MTPENFQKAHDWYEKYNFVAVFGAGFTPIPFKVATISAGLFFGLSPKNFAVFLFASTVSRSARFFLVAILMRVYGARIAPFLEKHLGWVTLVFFVLLIGGFTVLKYVL